MAILPEIDFAILRCRHIVGSLIVLAGAQQSPGNQNVAVRGIVLVENAIDLRPARAELPGKQAVWPAQIALRPFPEPVKMLAVAGNLGEQPATALTFSVCDPSFKRHEDRDKGVARGGHAMSREGRGPDDSW